MLDSLRRTRKTAVPQALLSACLFTLMQLLSGCASHRATQDCENYLDPVYSQAACSPSELGVSLSGLFHEMSSLEVLAHPPAVPFHTYLASSYDRASVSPDASTWFANNDRGNYVRVDGAEVVLMEDLGPGVITRIWSANPSGTVRVYLDNATLPAIVLPMDALLAGEVEPFSNPFGFSAAGGNELYFPLAYQSYARVSATSEDLYYQVNYRSYPRGISVETWSGNVPSAAYNEAKDALTHLQRTKQDKTLHLHTGASEWQRLDEARAGAITQLQVIPSRSDADSLRGTVLELRFDGTQTVRVPLGDFFGTGPGANQTDSLAFEVDPDKGALLSKFIMPFSHSAELRFSQGTAEPMDVVAQVTLEERDPIEPVWYFHAGWTGLLPFDALVARDLRLFELDGAGQYVGLVLNVANPDPQWWGEGDEKIYVDGERFPSSFGTGTEDYFGYGWCSTQPFSTAFVGQTRANRGDNAGYVSLYRLHLLDRVPFSTSLRFDLEALHWATGNRSVEMTYDAVYFWYGDVAATDRAASVPASSFYVPKLPEGVVEVSGGPFVSCQ